MGANSPVWKGSLGLIETAESGKLHLAERITYTQQYAGPYVSAVAYGLAHPRGSTWSFVIGNGPSLWSVEDTSIDQQKGGKGVVTVNYLSLSITPPEEFALTPFEINPAVEKHSFFKPLTTDDIKKCRAAFNSASAAGSSTVSATIEACVNKALMKSLLSKWMRGEENFYLAGFNFKHTIFLFTPPFSTKGGYPEFPFGAFSGYVNNADMDWLRQADEVVWSNGIWKLTRTWLGGPSGHWDSDIYPAP